MVMLLSGFCVSIVYKKDEIATQDIQLYNVISGKTLHFEKGRGKTHGVTF
jgi:hypothetical protein